VEQCHCNTEKAIISLKEEVNGRDSRSLLSFAQDTAKVAMASGGSMPLQLKQWLIQPLFLSQSYSALHSVDTIATTSSVYNHIAHIVASIAYPGEDDTTAWSTVGGLRIALWREGERGEAK